MLAVLGGGGAKGAIPYRLRGKICARITVAHKYNLFQSSDPPPSKRKRCTTFFFSPLSLPSPPPPPPPSPSPSPPLPPLPPPPPPRQTIQFFFYSGSFVTCTDPPPPPEEKDEEKDVKKTLKKLPIFFFALTLPSPSTPSPPPPKKKIADFFYPGLFVCCTLEGWGRWKEKEWQIQDTTAKALTATLLFLLKCASGWNCWHGGGTGEAGLHFFHLFLRWWEGGRGAGSIQETNNPEGKKQVFFSGNF